MDIFGNTFINHENIIGSVSITEKQIEKNLLERGDVLFNRTSEVREEIGMTAFYDDDKKAVFGGFVIRGRPKSDKLMPEFCAHGFQVEMVRRQIIRKGQGAVRVNIGQSDLEQVYFPIPPKREQREIVAILSSWDEAIFKTEKLIQAKKQYKKGIMQRLLSGRVRFPEFVKSEEKKETRFGDYPKDWAYKGFQDVATQVKDKVGNGADEYTVMSCTKHNGLVSSLEYFDRQVFSKDISNYKAVKKGEFAYATNHIEEGSIGYNDWCEKGAISPMYTVFETDSSKMDNDFLYAILKTEKYRRIFEIFTNGTVNRRGSLRWKDFKKIKVPVPSIEEQKAISTLKRTLDIEVELLENKLQKYQKQKKGLMQKLLTGKVRVNNE
ncbi:restriction endonuclease subunit S [soil metagenome]